MIRTTSWKKVLSGALLAGAGLAGYATLVEPRWLKLRRVTIHVRRLPRQLEGLRIGLLTDLHAGSGTPLSLIRRASRMVMRERPDLIALTGDFASDDAGNFRGVLAALDTLRAPLGVYAVPGNHDHIVGIEQWHRDVGAHPTIQDLTNAAIMREVAGARLCIAGVDDYYEGDPQLEVLPPPDERDLTILLAHSPDQAERARRTHDRVDLVLSGHTHGGQIRLPWLGAIVNSADHEMLYDEGLRRRPWTQVYVSRGVGTVHLPVRFWCRPEVSLLTLTRGRRPPLPGSRLP
jgi:uncharacterized protein